MDRNSSLEALLDREEDLTKPDLGMSKDLREVSKTTRVQIQTAFKEKTSKKPARFKAAGKTG